MQIPCPESEPFPLHLLDEQVRPYFSIPPLSPSVARGTGVTKWTERNTATVVLNALRQYFSTHLRQLAEHDETCGVTLASHVIARLQDSSRQGEEEDEKKGNSKKGIVDIESVEREVARLHRCRRIVSRELVHRVSELVKKGSVPQPAECSAMLLDQCRVLAQLSVMLGALVPLKSLW